MKLQSTIIFVTLGLVLLEGHGKPTQRDNQRPFQGDRGNEMRMVVAFDYLPKRILKRDSEKGGTTKDMLDYIEGQEEEEMGEEDTPDEEDDVSYEKDLQDPGCNIQ